MVIAEISVVPIGTGTPGISQYVAECIRVLDKNGIHHTLTPMGTVLEGTLDEVLEGVRLVHNIPFSQGALRVLTRVAIDERRDREASAQDKVKSVRARLQKK